MKKMEALNNKILKAVECLAAILMASIAVMILIQDSRHMKNRQHRISPYR